MRAYRKRAPRYEYMMVTADEYEDVMFSTETAAQLARIVGAGLTYIYIAIKKQSRYKWRGQWYKFIKIEIGDDDDDGQNKDV